MAAYNKISFIFQIDRKKMFAVTKQQYFLFTNFDERS